MNLTLGQIKIKPKHYIYATIILTLLMGTLCDDLDINSMMRYGNDVFTFMLFISLVINMKTTNVINHAKSKYINISIMVFTIANLLSVIINLVPITLVIWAIRNTYRFFIFYWACIAYLEHKDLDCIFGLLYKLQWINILIVGYQYFILGLKQDSLGGIFGHGGNAGLLIYSVLLLTYAVSKYTQKEYSLFQFLFILLSTSIVSALAEIRIFFVIVAIILLINFILSKFSFRKLIIVVGAIALFFVSIKIYAELFPYVTLSIEAFISEGTSTGGGYNISRLNAFSEINNMFFKGDIIKNLFGFGFGNCEYSSFDIFCSQFYNKYGFLNYRWFANQWIFLETGYAGVISYCSIIVIILFQSLLSYKKLLTSDKALMQTTISMAIVCLVLFVYNSLLKADYAYIAFFSLAISAIIIKNRSVKDHIEKDGGKCCEKIHSKINIQRKI